MNLAGVEVILNMRRKIEQMQGEVNEFMEYVKRELARGIDDWEQRLSTALVKSDVDRSRARESATYRTASRQTSRAKKTRDAEKTSRYHLVRASAGARQEPCPICNGTGWKSFQDAGVERVTRCDCWRDLAVRKRLDGGSSAFPPDIATAPSTTS